MAEGQISLGEVLEMDMRGRLRDREKIIDFILGGNATITIRSTKTGKRFTYCIRSPKNNGDDPRPPIWFVSAMTGSDNEGSFAYFGDIRHTMSYNYARRPRLAFDDPAVRAFEWFWGVLRLERDEALTQVEVWHEGRCGRCGKKLTVPESISLGFGPECMRKRR